MANGRSDEEQRRVEPYRREQFDWRDLVEDEDDESLDDPDQPVEPTLSASEETQVSPPSPAPSPTDQEKASREEEMAAQQNAPQPTLTNEQLIEALTLLLEKVDTLTRRLEVVDQLNRGVTALHRRVDELEIIPNTVRAVVEEALKVKQVAPQTEQPAQTPVPTQQPPARQPRRATPAPAQTEQAETPQTDSVLDMLRKRRQPS